MNIFEKLLAIQTKLKAPKNQHNDFGNYHYRNCEDILEAVKPICKEYKAVLILSDEIVFIEGRHYVQSTARLFDCEKPEMSIYSTASAREEERKKGMDESQVTGSSSSYARKYALNGLFDIDDTKDSDSTNKGAGKKKEENPDSKKENLSAQTQTSPLTEKEIQSYGVKDVTKMVEWLEDRRGKSLSDFDEEEKQAARETLKRKQSERAAQKKSEAGDDDANN